MAQEFSGQVVVISGDGRGIGRGMAIAVDGSGTPGVY